MKGNIYGSWVDNVEQRAFQVKYEHVPTRSFIHDHVCRFVPASVYLVPRLDHRMWRWIQTKSRQWMKGFLSAHQTKLIAEWVYLHCNWRSNGGKKTRSLGDLIMILITQLPWVDEECKSGCSEFKIRRRYHFTKTWFNLHLDSPLNVYNTSWIRNFYFPHN